MALPDFGDMPPATVAAWEEYERKGDEFMERMAAWVEIEEGPSDGT